MQNPPIFNSIANLIRAIVIYVDCASPQTSEIMGEVDAADTPKRKRGRPRKPESEKVATKRKASTSDDGSAPKRGRGRPKGSKNKPAKKTTTKGASKRGRKSAAKTEEVEAEEEEEAE
ncbi:hypothetical protein Pcinc_019825 [Petrolisthes cinctipes]|uniref:Uncharacterized protein n=1 Tax=Petrolisthes cinctipes TaxID=88211 RepID=A0AAE1KM58_PETCI|nr:hypothetical protein Pcinc_019825 [Petrolisthes cinctipes]